ncbi:hypothetical protein CHUAL_004897 [Chamberlinius hualienensis]
MAEGKNNNSFGWPSSSEDIHPSPENDERAMDVPEPKRKRFNALHVVKRIFRRKPKPPLKKDPEQSSNIKSRSTGELAVLVASNSDTRHTAASSTCCSESQDDSLAAPYNGMSLSHDSVFVPEDDHSLLSPIKGSKQKGFSFNSDINKELASRIRARRIDADSDDDDAGLPHSPSTSPTTADILHQGLTKKSKQFRSSDGSLLSMGSSETDNEDGSTSPKLLFEGTGTDPELDVGTTVLLNSQAARHKIAIRPRRKQSAVPSQRSSQTAVIVSPLPSTPEDNEDLVATQNKIKTSKASVSPKEETSVHSVVNHLPPVTSPSPPVVNANRFTQLSKQPSFEENKRVSKLTEIRVTENHQESDVQRVRRSSGKAAHSSVSTNVRKSRDIISNVVERCPSPPADYDIVADVIRQEQSREEEKTSTSCFNFSRTTKKESVSSIDKLEKTEPQSPKKVNKEKDDAAEYGFTGDVTLRRPKAVETVDYNKIGPLAHISEPKSASISHKEAIVLESVKNEVACSSDDFDQKKQDNDSSRPRSNSVRRVSSKIAQLQGQLASMQSNLTKTESQESSASDFSDSLSEKRITNGSVGHSASSSAETSYSDEPIYSNDLRRRPLEHQLSKEDIDELEKSFKRSLPASSDASKNNIAKTMENFNSQLTKDSSNLNFNQKLMSQQYDRKSVHVLGYGKVSTNSDGGIPSLNSTVPKPQVTDSFQSRLSNRKSSFIASESTEKGNGLPSTISYRQSTDTKVEVVEVSKTYRSLSTDSFNSTSSESEVQKNSPPVLTETVKMTSEVNIKPESAEKMTENVAGDDSNKESIWDKFGPRSSFKLRQVKPLPPEKNVGIEPSVRIQIVSSTEEATESSEKPKELKNPSFRQRPQSLFGNLKLNSSTSMTNGSSASAVNTKKEDAQNNEFSTKQDVPASEDNVSTNVSQARSFLRDPKWMSVKPLQMSERKSSVGGKLSPDSLNIEITESKPIQPPDLVKPVILTKTPPKTTSIAPLTVTGNYIPNESPRMRKTSFLDDSENPRIGSSFISSVNRRSSVKSTSSLLLNTRQNHGTEVNGETSKNAENSAGDLKIKEPETYRRDSIKNLPSSVAANGGLSTSTTVMDNGSGIDSKPYLQQKVVDVAFKTPINYDAIKEIKTVTDENSVAGENPANVDKSAVPEWRKALLRQKEEKELKLQQEKEIATIQAATIIIREPEAKSKQMARKSKVLDMVDNYQNRPVY